MTTSRVTLRIQEVAQQKVLRLLSLISKVSEDEYEIQKALETTASLKKIVIALGISGEDAEVAKVFEILTPEFAQNKALYLLSKASGISEETIREYDTREDVDLKNQNFLKDLRIIADALNVSLVALIKPVAKKQAVKLKILELLQNMTTEENEEKSLKTLSEKSHIDLPIICFYSTQPLEKQKLDEPQFQTNLKKISEVLGCSVEDLKDTNKAELPQTRLRIQEFIEERNLTLEDLSLLSGTTLEFIELIARNPVDMEAINEAWLGDNVFILRKIIDIIFSPKTK
jgi:hypothetical protein